MSDTTVNGCGEVRSIGRFKVDQGNIIFFIQCQISGIVIRNVVIFLKGSQYGFPGFFRYGSFIIYNFVNGICEELYAECNAVKLLYTDKSKI